ncbi:RrF2 family transcriptional regulator [Desulfohalobium retbaense]|uniref:Transcriptional regulator, BadM/Rrf2 family n=1 Tax=Desulfohalobium retbaense (strain ATCC 49708 / DSM 5692 / JCM 16813 / HR100) TaxID=485915 RepID=C8X173_DESRD|nr:Rrf2 family transcriptional regulator [Desulfohalobium retbaense]ACV68170.1 transcriptional regulator, BadM/Rrf2 family [Desulfohalobium retbaense DSM 5692]
MRLSTRSRYGIRLMLDIAQQGQHGPVALRDVADRQDISLKYLEKLSRRLRESGFLMSRLGAKGGYVLGRPAAEITIKELIESLEGHVGLVQCWLEEKACSRVDQCLAYSLWARINEVLARELNAITLADMLFENRMCLLEGPKIPCMGGNETCSLDEGDKEIS